MQEENTLKWRRRRGFWTTPEIYVKIKEGNDFSKRKSSFSTV